jgi:hypothetical protein
MTTSDRTIERRGQRSGGYALVLVLLLVAAATVVGMAYLSTSAVKAQSSRNMADLSRAKYLCESGLIHAIALVQQDPANAIGTSGGPYAIGDPEARYVFSSSWVDASAGLARIQATGSVGAITKTCSVDVRLASTYPDLIESMGPIAYWRLGETSGAMAADQTGSYPGLYMNGPQRGAPGALPGDSDTAAHFDGANDYVHVPNVDVSSNAMSIALWFKTEEFMDGHPWLISKAVNDGKSDTWWGMLLDGNENDAHLVFRLKTDENGTEELKTSDKLEAELADWVFVVGTYRSSAGAMKLYVNGVLANSREQDGTVSVAPTIPMWIGQNQKGVGEKPFHGSIDEVAIFSRRLTASEITALYEARLAELKVLSWNP